MQGVLVWCALLVAASACKSKPKEEPAASPPSTAPSAAAGDAALSADAAPPPDALPEPGCEGWRAAKVEHLGMGQISVTVTCAANKITWTRESVGARDDEAETETRTLSRDEWNQLWQRLEAAGWRALDPACPAVVPPPESMSVTELELTISDGKTTKQVTCEGANVTAVHEQLMSAIDADAR